MIQYGCSSTFANKNSKACSIFMKTCSVSTFFTLFPPSGSLCPSMTDFENENGMSPHKVGSKFVEESTPKGADSGTPGVAGRSCKLVCD